MSKATSNPIDHRRRNMPINDAHVVAFHPGPDAGTAIPVEPVEAADARLARLESEFLDAAIERALEYGGSESRGNAAVIVALRARVAAEAVAA